MSTQSTTPPKTRISAEMFTRLQKNMNETRRAFDAFSNPIARLGVGTDSLLEGTQYPLTRLSFNYILLQSLYRSNWIARKVVDAVAEDMTKNWVRVDTQMSPNQLQAFDQTIKKTATRAQLLTTMKWGRLFGGAAAIMVIEGHEEQLEEELDFDDVELGSFKGLIPLDRWSGIAPSGALCSDINRPFDFGLPEFYTVQPNNGSSFKIHCSRVLRFIGHDLPVWEKQVEQYWGISVIEPMFEELKKFDNTSWNIANLVFRANIIALRQKGLDQMLSGLGASAQAQKNFYASLEAQSRLLSSQGLLILPEDGGIEEHSYSFGGMKEVYESFKENICGSVDIPYSRLFGRPPGGLSTTNEGDEFAYYENVGAKQNREVDPQLQKLMPVVAMSTWGKIPKDFNWKFNPVRALTNETRSTLGKDKTTSVVEVYNTGLVSDKTALMELKAQTEETGLWSNITDEDIEKADDEPKGAMMMGEGAGLGMEEEEGPAPKKPAPKKAKDEAVRKYTQVEAQYEFPAKGRDVCLNCEYFKDGEKPECSQTLGPIQAKGWCKFYSLERRALDAEFEESKHPRGAAGTSVGGQFVSKGGGGGSATGGSSESSSSSSSPNPATKMPKGTHKTAGSFAMAMIKEGKYSDNEISAATQTHFGTKTDLNAIKWYKNKIKQDTPEYKAKKAAKLAAIAANNKSITTAGQHPASAEQLKAAHEKTAKTYSFFFKLSEGGKYKYVQVNGATSNSSLVMEEVKNIVKYNNPKASIHIASNYDPSKPLPPEGVTTLELTSGLKAEVEKAAFISAEKIAKAATEQAAKEAAEAHLKASSAAKTEHTSPLTSPQRESLKQYTNGEYRYINAQLRSGQPLTATQAQLAYNIDSAIKNSRFTEDSYVYRGIGNITAFFGPQVKVGTTVLDNGYLSTSKKFSTASGFSSGGYVARISVKKGARGLDVSNLSLHPSESEVVLPRGSMFVVKNITGKIVECEYVSN